MKNSERRKKKQLYARPSEHQPKSLRRTSKPDDLGGPRQRRTCRGGRRKTHEEHTMALSFPNRMRFYDTARCAVGFWGHDGAMESSFFVAADSLKRLQPAMRFNENSILA